MRDDFCAPTPARRPRVIANFAMSADGKVAAEGGGPSGFASARDKRLLREIRAGGDALIVGRRTLEADRMSMSLPPDLCRQRESEGRPRYPLRVVVSGSGGVPADSRIFETEGGEILIFSEREENVCPEIAGREGVRVLQIPEDGLAGLLGILLEEFGVERAVCEGGPMLFRGFVEAGCVDELFLTVAPLIFGGLDAPTLTGAPGAFLPEPARFKLDEVESVDGEAFLRYTKI